MKKITVYPTNKLEEAGQSVPLAAGIVIEPRDKGAIEIEIRNNETEKIINHYVKIGKLSLSNPDEKEPTKKDLIAEAEELGLEWSDKEKKFTNDTMKEIIAQHKESVEARKVLVGRATELKIELTEEELALGNADLKDLIDTKEKDIKA